MTSQDLKSLSNSERLASIQGEAKLDGVPCRGVCTTTYGDLSCGTCGRSQEEITHWNTFTSHQKKLINIRNASSGFKIRQLESQESRWEELQKLKTIDNLTIRDAIKRVVSVATNQGEMFDQDYKCIDLLTKIITSDHKFNDLSIKSLMSEDDYQEVKNKFESSF
tara:strand:+ start:205 stop:699 length:495 start_codon:yes stop_codon:yes gene_type:complete